MEYKKDFVTEETVKINIEGREFLFKPTTGGDETKWLKDIMTIDPETKATVVDWGEYNKKKLNNILKVPYSKELIHEVIKVDKEWIKLNSEERNLFLGKLTPGMMDKLINAIKEIDSPDEKAIKN